MELPEARRFSARQGSANVAKTFPVRVTWRDADGKARSKGFWLLPRAMAHAKALKDSASYIQVWAQGELFSEGQGQAQKTYSMSDEIPY